jgi:NAD(P)-dependent dehydrogenase (short-subunit alcohol dehydrogenase family)
MSILTGKTAVISGGAEGIGFAIGKAMGLQGMNIVLGDIDPDQLARAKQQLSELGISVAAVHMDVCLLEDWDKLAQAAVTEFGKVHMLVNNAGVGGAASSIEGSTEKDWRWVLDVNLMGVMHGTCTMVPRIKEHGEGGWIINVASMAGMVGVPFAGAYTASKVAVVGMSESWQAELAPENIQVSVLCPAFVRTRINLSQRNQQSNYQETTAGEEQVHDSLGMAKRMQDVIDKGLDPDIVGARVVEAVLAKELYIFTHPNYRGVLQHRLKAIDEAFERAAASPLLVDVLHEPIVNFS